MIWRLARQQHDACERVIACFNLRADRASRTSQLASTRFWHDADKVALIGSGTYLFARCAARHGFETTRLVYAEDLPVDQVFESLVDHCGRSTLVVGMGNVAGIGLQLTRYCRNRSRLQTGVS